MRSVSPTFAVLTVSGLLLAGCGSSSGTGSILVPGPGSCAAPLPVEAQDYVLTVDVPSDFDASASPTPTPTTQIAFSVLLPERCPGQSFPLVLQSHGYSGTRDTYVDESAATSSSTTTSHVRAGGRPADDAPRASSTPTSTVSGAGDSTFPRIDIASIAGTSTGNVVEDGTQTAADGKSAFDAYLGKQHVVLAFYVLDFTGG